MGSGTSDGVFLATPSRSRLDLIVAATSPQWPDPLEIKRTCSSGKGTPCAEARLRAISGQCFCAIQPPPMLYPRRLTMNGSLRAKLFASAIALSAVPLAWSTVPAFSQQEVSFDAFHDALAPDGDWVYSDRWGEVWVPENVPDDFHPYYTAGRWIDTDEYGWLWQSDYDWGDITFHYGRWVNDPDDGWLWIPGYVWSPGWVIWRSNDRDTGWMPM